MEKKPPKPMIPFDELVNPPTLQMLKLFLPYTPASNQQFLGIFVKFLELNETISFFQKPKHDLHTQAFSGNTAPSPMEMMAEIKPYLPSQENEMIENLLNMMNMMEMVRMFQESAQGQENPDGSTSEGGSTGDNNMGGFGNMFSGGLNPMDMMMGMLTPDQQNMFQMYNEMFSDETPPDQATSENENSNDSPTDNNDAQKDTLSETDKNNINMEGDDKNE
jgi:hypothetical protein